MKINWRLSLGMAVGNLDGEIDVPDDATEDEIAEAVKEDADQHIQLSWERAAGLSEENE